MADIALRFEDFAGGDLFLDGQDLARDDGLESAVLVSLFTDRRATLEQIRAGDDPADLRGWWGDYRAAVDGDQIGSHLWLLRREKQTAEVLSRARQYAEQALAWMIEDKVAKSVTVTTEYGQAGWLLIESIIERPNGSRVRYRYDYEWAAQAAKRAA
ncbi:MAG: phage GP46 family protein [Steroidobacteraceae bacterium]